MKPEKNKEYIVDIIDNGFDGEGIAKIDDFAVFIKGAIKGEKIRVLILKVLTSYAFGKIVEIIERSPKRIEPDCTTYKRCGGCSLRHIDYEETLQIKQNIVQSLVNKTLNNKIEVNNTLSMKTPFYYRNKLQYPVGVNKDNKPVMGVFANRTHEIIPVDNCLIQNKQAQKVAKDAFEFIKNNNISIYNENTRSGLVRHIIVKIGIKTDAIMCIIVINGKSMPKEKEFVDYLINKNENVKSIIKNINMKNTNVILGNENVNLFGNGYIQDVLGEYKFNISAMSFYQVNPVQAERLYNLGVKGAMLNKDDIVFDLYCGIGTISLFMAKYAKKVYGVEIVKEAIDMANENAKINDIENVKFIAGDVEVVLDQLINKNGIIPNVIMVDPPRRGLDNKSIDNILKIMPDRLVYISCNPATLVRDLSKLEDCYEVKSIQPVDMFPYTSHVECCSVLKLRQSLKTLNL